MDELELLKKDWKNQEGKFPKLTYDDIYNMILKKSSSIVKWIFIMSILEFVFWLIISFSFKDSESMQRFQEYGSNTTFYTLTILSYVILAYFFYLFYMNYKRISATDNSKRLMENILRTRRTVKQYVAFNLIVLFISTFVALAIMFDNDPNFINLIEEASANGNVFVTYAKVILATLFVLAILIVFILAFYYLIYGILLKRLNTNYKELKKLEV